MGANCKRYNTTVCAAACPRTRHRERGMKMQRTWYKRLLLSYFPILLITIGIIVLISISIINEISIKETEKANHIFSRYVTDSIQTSLKGLERVILEELSSNQTVYQFFEPNVQTPPPLANYETSRALRKLLDEYPFFHSIYLYRVKDQVVLTKNAIEPLNDFLDKDYVMQALEQPAATTWSDVRSYSDLSLDPKENVITMTKRAMLPFGNQGIVVVNVRVDALLAIVDEMINKDITFMDIRGADGQRVYPVKWPEGESAFPDKPQGNTVSHIHSDYIGWDFISGIRAGKMFEWMKVISHIWLGVGILTVLASIVYMLHITRRNYRPIEAIVKQVQAIQSRSTAKGKDRDEFAFIGRVLGSLIDQSLQYEKQHREDLIVRRKQLFQELIQGNRRLTPQQWAQTMERFRLPQSFTRLVVSIVEIDQYRCFRQQFSEEDQGLLKFALSNVASEFYFGDGRSTWAEWIAANRLAVLYIEEADNVLEADSLNDTIEKFRTWVAVNLKFSVTVGIGSSVGDAAGISRSYLQASTALSYKMSLGNNQAISFDELQEVPTGDTHKYYQLANGMLEDFRVASPSWPTQLEQLTQYLAHNPIRDEEIRNLLHYLIGLFRRAMDGYPAELRDYWQQHTQPKLSEALEEAETLEEALPVFTSCFKQLYEQYAAAREAKSQRHLINDIRAYIEGNYANPDLSLKHLSDKFAINGKYSSQLFKAEFGMKFVDFLVSLRMQQAKKLLLECEDSINDISSKVGYTHPISFGRTFKKIVGVTPGDYRKYMQDTQTKP